MFSRLFGAAIRAILVILLISLSSLIVPGTQAANAQIVMLIALFGAGLVLFEYGSAYPGLVEFRDAPPFNRVRFCSLFLTIALLSLMSRHHILPGPITEMAADAGAFFGRLIDFPYSPVRLVVLMLPPDANVDHIHHVRDAAGMAYLISILTLIFFVLLLYIRRWPMRSGVFNVWVNLPTFDPTAGGDVVERLERDARFNVALGFLLPFLTPAVVKSATSLFGAVSLDNPQTLIWTVTAWAFLPASLLMRGIAMGRIASLITEKRKLSSNDEGNAGLLPV